jgi:hypothetical protein
MQLRMSAIVFSCLLSVASTASGVSILSSTDGTNTIYLGVNSLGHLNVEGGPVVNGGPGPAEDLDPELRVTGLAYDSPSINTTQAGLGRLVGPVDATSPGCFCEGWGVSADTTVGAGVSNAFGYANVSSGTDGLTLGSFVHDDPGGPSAVGPHGTMATSTVTVTSLPGLTVSQAYTVAIAGAWFRNHVTITNSTGGTLEDVRYVRVIDWDVPFTEFSEFVTVVGTDAANLEYSNDNGFASAQPANADGPIDPSSIMANTTNVDFSGSEPFDHGAYFRFNFGALVDDGSVSFDIFYGAGPTEALVLATLGSLDPTIELYSLGQSSPPSGNPLLGTPVTYAMAFAGVDRIPEPNSLGLLLSMLLGIRCIPARRQDRRKNRDLK